MVQKFFTRISKVAIFVLSIVTVGVFSSCDKQEEIFKAPQVVNQQEELEVSPTNELRSVILPYGWAEIDENHPKGIRCFKGKTEGVDFYVLKVYIPEVQIQPVYQILDSTNQKNPTFYKQPLSDWLNTDPSAFAMINASFFNLDNSVLGQTNPFGYGLKGSKAELAHPLGKNGKYISSGYAPEEEGIRYFKVTEWDQRAVIDKYKPMNNFEVSLGGLDLEEAKKDPDSNRARTVFGTERKRSNILYVLITPGATQALCKKVLETFGCKRFIMFDGSGSTQFAWRGEIKVESSDNNKKGIRRNIPVALKFIKRPNT